jgi:hypothetical protein
MPPTSGPHLSAGGRERREVGQRAPSWAERGERAAGSAGSQRQRIGGNRLGPREKKKRMRRRVGGPRDERGRERAREGFVFFSPFTH